MRAAPEAASLSSGFQPRVLQWGSTWFQKHHIYCSIIYICINTWTQLFSIHWDLYYCRLVKLKRLPNWRNNTLKWKLFKDLFRPHVKLKAHRLSTAYWCLLDLLNAVVRFWMCIIHSYVVIFSLLYWVKLCCSLFSISGDNTGPK